MTDNSIDIDWLASRFPDLDSIERVGSGGQKWVFAATHPVDGAIVLKLLKPNTSVSLVRRELRAQSTIQSRRIPQVFGDGTVASPVGDLLWIREKRIAGSDLRTHQSSCPLELTLCHRFAYQIAEALLAAEKQQIVHRDVKPDNVLIDSRQSFWLIDFGIARHLDLASLTPSDSPFGKATPGYAPLEQVYNRKRDIDARTDAFAYGVTLYECLHGHNPFRKDKTDVNDVIEMMEETVCLTVDRVGTPETLAVIISACTQREYHHRPASFSVILNLLSEMKA
jgi:serine/threonine-protein kinase